MINILNALVNNQKIIVPDRNEKFNPITITKKIKITQPSRNDNILILNAKEYNTPEPNPYLVNAIVKSYYYHKQIRNGKTIEDLQNEEGLKGFKIYSKHFKFKIYFTRTNRTNFNRNSTKRIEFAETSMQYLVYYIFVKFFDKIF